MIFYFAMVNAWSLLGSIVNGTFEKDYPLMDKSKKNGVKRMKSENSMITMTLKM